MRFPTRCVIWPKVCLRTENVGVLAAAAKRRRPWWNAHSVLRPALNWLLISSRLINLFFQIKWDVLEDVWFVQKWLFLPPPLVVDEVVEGAQRPCTGTKSAGVYNPDILHFKTHICSNQSFLRKSHLISMIKTLRILKTKFFSIIFLMNGLKWS